MVEPESQTAIQAWLIAIPTVLTALAHWYTNRKTTKTVEKSDAKTAQVVAMSSGATMDEIEKLTGRVAALEKSIDKIGGDQSTLSAKYSESILQLRQELALAKEMLARFMASKMPISATAQKGEVEITEKPPEDLGKVTTIASPDPVIGKVKWEK